METPCFTVDRTTPQQNLYEVYIHDKYGFKLAKNHHTYEIDDREYLHSPYSNITTVFPTKPLENSYFP